MDETMQSLLRQLPSVQEVLDRAEIAALVEAQIPAVDVKEAVRDAVAARRRALLDGEAHTAEIDSAEVIARAKRLAEPSLIPLVNATGVVVHTNLGRSPLPPEVMERAMAIACGYSNLEYDLEAGGRGHRHAHAARLLARVTGAEAVLVVNNCASAVMLCLSALARGREVIVSRGEEVEIGGAFRVPDVMAQSGARLVEVGTTNRTRLADYERAITDDTAVLLKVHRSNFAVVGFTEETPLADLAALARDSGLLSMMDLGSGLLTRPPGAGYQEESTVAEVIRSGVDVITFSGDKLLGGPQAGIIAGRADVIRILSRHPLLRALRPDKLTFALLEGILALHAAGRGPEAVPTTRMLHEDAAAVAARRDALLARLGEDLPAALTLTPIDTVSRPGGGTSPLTELPSAGLAVTHGSRSAEQLAAALRGHRPPVIGRIEQDTLVLDLRTVLPEALDDLADALRSLG